MILPMMYPLSLINESFGIVSVAVCMLMPWHEADGLHYVNGLRYVCIMLMLRSMIMNQLSLMSAQVTLDR